MKYQVEENCLTIFLPKEVDHHQAEEIRKDADAMIERNHIKYVIFDFGETEFMDSSGIGVIIGRCRNIGYYGGSACAKNLNGRLKKIFLVSGLQELMREESGKTGRKETEKL